jgi:hypothetical protein
MVQWEAKLEEKRQQEQALKATTTDKVTDYTHACVVIRV